MHEKMEFFFVFFFSIPEFFGKCALPPSALEQKAAALLPPPFFSANIYGFSRARSRRPKKTEQLKSRPPNLSPARRLKGLATKLT